MSSTIRIRGQRLRRGRAAAIVLLVLAAVCLIVGAAGSYFAYSGFQNLMGMLANVASPSTPPLVAPGEMTIKGGPGAVMVVARATDSAGERSFSYTPGSVTVSATDSQGNPLKIAQQAGGPGGPMPLPDGGSLFIVAVFEAKAADTFTVKATGAESLLRVKLLEGKDAETAAKGAITGAGGGLGALCGCGGFLVFGVIGGILLIFGKRKAA
ncbi:MAG: hypothetical protein U0572_08295 [Phycisphaerales bacterium]